MIGFAPDGTIPLDLPQQVENTFQNIGQLLVEAGASFSDVLSLTSYHVGSVAEQLEVVAPIKDRYCPPPNCAWTAVGVTSLAVNDARIEIQAIARVPHAARIEAAPRGSK